MSIQEHLNKIRNAIYGREVRESIAKGIETAYDDASENGNANMEVKIARGTHPNLRSRLEEVDEKQQQTTAQLAQKAEKTYVDTSISTLDTKINSQASGSPKATYATLVALETAHPNGNANIYVVTADGKWYYWNNSVWTPGGIYQSTGLGALSVGNAELKDGVDASKLKGVTRAIRNLFDRSKVTSGGYYSYDTGVWVASTTVVSSNLIEVEYGEVYATNKTFGHLFYDENQIYIGGSTGALVVADTRIKYVRLTVSLVQLNSLMLVNSGTLPSEYIPYTATNFELSKEYSLNVANREITSVAMSKLEGTTVEKSVNLFDPEKVTWGGYYSWEALTYVEDASYGLSDYIEVKNTTYTRSHPSGLLLYDKSKTLISGTNKATFTIPAGIYYVRNVVHKPTYNTLMLVEGSESPVTYVPYKYEVSLPENVRLSKDYNLNVTNKDISNVSLDALEGVIVDRSVNLFDVEKVTWGGYYNWDNLLYVEAANYGLSDYIEVKNTVYTRSHASGLLFYDQTKTLVSGTNKATFSVPEGIYYVRNVVINTIATSLMLVEGSEVPSDYVPYKYEVTLPEQVKLSAKGRVTPDYEANSKVPLFIETYYEGGNQITHPKVIDLGEGVKISGYRFWMAYTPYPNTTSEEENPCVAASNDLIKWETPQGLVNPIDDKNNYSNVDYLSDTHIQYVNGFFEVWYRAAKKPGSNGEVIYRMKSADGINWGAPEVLLETNDVVISKFLSPAFVYDDTNNVYKIWVANDSAKRIDYYESIDGTDWQFKNSIAISCWHLDVDYFDGIYEMVIMKRGTGGSDLIYYKSDDGINWSGETLIMSTNLPHPYAIDNKLIYRAALLKVDGYYYIYYGAQATDATWSIGLSITQNKNDITSFRGIDGSFVDKMAKMTKKPLYANIGDTLYDHTLQKVIHCVQGGLTVASVWKDANGTVV